MQSTINQAIIYPFWLSSESEASVIDQSDALKMQHTRKHSTLLSVLIVEDDLISQQVAQLMVESLGYQATVVATAKLALEHYYKHDLILLDLGLPDMSGLAVCKQIRAQVMGKTIPILALTAHLNCQEKCFAAGMNAFLTKPIELNVLKEILTHYLKPN